MTAIGTTQGSTTAPGAATRRTRLLTIDAVVSAPAGLALAATAPWLDGTLGAPSWLLLALGGFFLVYAATLIVLARMGAPRPAVLAVAAGNVSWAVLTAAVLATDALTLTAAGTAVAVLQGAFVAVIGVLQYRAAR